MLKAMFLSGKTKTKSCAKVKLELLLSAAYGLLRDVGYQFMLWLKGLSVKLDKT